MKTVANKQKICDVLMEAAKTDKDIVALCSDSRGSGSFTTFADTYPEQFVETGIAEQNLVSIAAGLAKVGKKSYAVSPASFLSTRSYEQCKVDVAYSNTNVKLIGISGGISYGALGMSHHSAQDIAAMSAIPNMRVYIPSDTVLTQKLTEELLKDEKPAYIRVGRNAVENVYEENELDFQLDRAVSVKDGEDILIVACGEITLDDYFITTYTKPSMFDTISTYVVNATKGAQTDVKTALWALSTITFLVVIFVVIAMNYTGRKEHEHEI